jgi:hypothetical protein
MSAGAQDDPVDPPTRSQPWLLLFALPPMLGVVGRLIKGGWWLNDFDAAACAAWRSARHLPFYGADIACPGGHPSAFVYLPQIAWALAPLAHAPTVSGLRLAYGLAYAGLMAWLVFTLYGRSRLGRFSPVPLLVLVTGGAAACGNLAAPCHALVLLAASLRRRRSAFLIAAILAAGVVKPVFLGYVLIFALDDAPVRMRALRIAATLALATGLAWILYLTGGEALIDWRQSLDHVVFGAQTGVGLLDALARVGLRADQFASQAAWAAFATLLALGAVAFAQVRRLDGAARLLLAIALAQLCNPRLMDYDLIMLGPGLAVVARSASPDLRRPLWLALVGICSLLLLLNLAELKSLEIRVGPALLAAFLLTAAGLEIRLARRPNATGVKREAPA